MFPLNKIPGILFVGLLVLTACFSAPPAIATPVPQPTATAIKVLPTPSIPGDSIRWGDLQVTMVQTEITEYFITEYGSTRMPSPGMKFMWVHIQLKYVGQNQIDSTFPERFSVLYAES